MTQSCGDKLTAALTMMSNSKRQLPLLAGAVAGVLLMPALFIADAAENTSGAPVYDLDANGQIDQKDFDILRAALGKCQGAAGYEPKADYDGDNCVNFIDYQKWYAAYTGK